MASVERYLESQSLCTESRAEKMSEEEIPRSTKTFKTYEYSGQRDFDPNQVECFLSSPSEAQDGIQAEKRDTLFCQICRISFEGSTSRHRLLEHINSIHSFNIYDKGETCRVCNSVFYTSNAFEMHKDACERESGDSISSTLHMSDSTEEIDQEKHENDESNSETTESNTTLNSEDDINPMKETIDDPEAFEETKELQSEKCSAPRIRRGRKEVLNNSLKCYICSKIFQKTRDFRLHLMSNHKNQLDEKDYDDLSYRCKKCATTFPNIILLRGHFFKKHTALIIYRCIVCHLTLKNKKSLRVHYNNFHAQKSKGLHPCDECGKELTNIRALKAHIRLKHGLSKNKQGFRCRLCQQKFDTKEERKLHYEQEHLGESPFMCNDCGKGFSSKSGLYGHRQLHKTDQPSTCPYCEKIFNRRDSYHEHILIHVGPRHRCPHCPKEFVQRSNLVRHIRIHTGQKPYTCTFCDKRFSDKGACNSHIRVHTKEEQCTCPYCGQTFTKKQKLKYHIRKHTGEGLISCEICSKTFTNAFALKEHRAIHDRQTQTICVECGKAFNSPKYLQRHVALVHQDPQDSTMTIHCPLCEKTFCHQTRLKSHLVSHLGKKHLQCLICEKRYSSTKSIRNHLKQSHDLRPDQPEFKKSFRSALESNEILVNSLQLAEDLCSPNVTSEDTTVLTFLFENESNFVSSRSGKESSEGKAASEHVGVKWRSEFYEKCSSGDEEIVSGDMESKNIELTEGIGYQYFTKVEKLREAREANCSIANSKDTNTIVNLSSISKLSDGYEHEVESKDENTNENEPLCIKTEDILNSNQNSEPNFETMINSATAIDTEKIPRKRSYKFLRSNSSAIIEDRDKVNEEANGFKSRNNSTKEILRDSEKDSRSSLESSKEINRRRKQLRTPKKYVSPIDTLETVDNKLKNVMPKRERVEAIARSLKKSSNLRESFIEQTK